MQSLAVKNTVYAFCKTSLL